MKSKTAAKSQGSAKAKKLILKKEKLADLSPRDKEADQLRGQTVKFGTERNHNETFVRAARRR